MQLAATSRSKRTVPEFAGNDKLIVLQWEGTRVAQDTSLDGFTLLEILLAVSVLGLILVLVTPNFHSGNEMAKQQIHAANIQRIEGAAQLFRLDIGYYPERVQDLVQCPSGVSGWRGPYLQEWPVNPWDQTRAYTIDAMGRAN